MELIEWVMLTLIVGVAGVVRGCIGFGFSALVVASATLFLAPSQVVPMIAVLEIAASIQMVLSTWRDTAWRILSYLLIGTLIATPLGVYALVVMPADNIRLLLSAVILIMSVLLAVGWQYRGPTGPVPFFGLGLVSGVCNGAAGVGGLPVATFLTAMNLTMTELRATLVMFFLLTDIILLSTASGHGLLNEELVWQSLAMMVPMGIGIFFGSRLFRVLPEKKLRRGVICLLILLSAVGIIRAGIQAFTG
ncbi:sulfite exporter TauE/SafE family protein [Aliamphritea hakodatensis]|uniref:sulfite exporter TauE/SafE family protein n=1 Tax=Aliamphritea hakodatensis TaxID=2895352 RepID=UPI0022FDA379|nr:sulfite exporter TauE/SafE family protein [Aliamphritea hakodatensis]